MTLEELDQIAESVRPENAKYDNEVNVCMGTGVPEPALGQAEGCAGEGG